MCMYILYLDILICKNSQRIVGVKGLVSIRVSRYVRMSQLADTKKKPPPTCSSLLPPGVYVCVCVRVCVCVCVCLVPNLLQM